MDNSSFAGSFRNCDVTEPKREHTRDPADCKPAAVVFNYNFN